MTIGPVFDDVLVAAQAGAGWARTQLYESLAPAVAGYLRAQGVRDPSDLTSEVFVAVLTRLRSFEGGEDAFRSWVFTIAYRKLVDGWRTANRAVPTLPQERVAPGAEELALTRLGDDRVHELLALLTDDQRHVLALRVIADLSLEAVAELLGKPVGAVKALQHRALTTLRRKIAGEAVSR